MLCSRVLIRIEGDGVDLPKLLTIQLGHTACHFADREDDTLIMKSKRSDRNSWTDLPILNTLTTVDTGINNYMSSTFKYPHHIILEGCIHKMS